ncbi:methylcrotonoyl-CoA carboxylase subunit alpha, mitochondrial-like isoform X2 [Corticium candelabrum]|uniref:methylcrotonoyl-CoA carboxylase subunit alpha, mitochondrial-like isoform X2 n=1 Tax=Corticium candelabrum TaxID=121492 RepID=UPI002E26F916|nr:methylcrotonoyl-CoA carboxylase subunit alpha, mitochondrial-like isoform X2 [Corticium candelabrum]
MAFFLPLVNANRCLSTQSSVAGHIRKVLIANRGEIACRIMRTAETLGIKTVAVYSDADRHALHVQMANESQHIGSASADKSYLCVEHLIEAAKRSNAEAIHPGYGFLSERFEFAEACEKEGIVFIGPPASAIRSMGDKIEAKQMMSSAGVPVILGYHDIDQSYGKLKYEAEKIGLPLMIKAALGGGGRGMRIVNSMNEFESQLESARSEAKSTFGNDQVLLEKYIGRPRHVEVQVFADRHGNAVYLYERDCSVQRRHQKIIEEAPAPGVDDHVRRDLGEAAVRAAKAVGYVGAGTVEFIMDVDKRFYFMEMNTRLQVEHPVTEMITNTDLVEWQFQVAAGHPLPLSQNEIPLEGHSFEARVYAEDPDRDFQPAAGKLYYLSAPDDVSRVETGVRQGDDISIYYDPMIAKVVVWGEDRSSALYSLIDALNKYHVVGIPTNLSFLSRLASHPSFFAGNVNTDFIKEHHQSLFPPPSSLPSKILAQAALVFLLHSQEAQIHEGIALADPTSPFSSNDLWRVCLPQSSGIKFSTGMDETVEVVMRRKLDGSYSVQLPGDDRMLDISGYITEYDSPAMTVSGSVDNHSFGCKAVFSNDTIHLFTEDGNYQVHLFVPKFVQELSGMQFGQNFQLIAADNGKVVKVHVSDGERVTKDQPLLMIETMKLQVEILSPFDGVIEQVRFTASQVYHSGALLIKFKDLPTTSPIPGEVLEVVVSEGQQVAAGEILMNVECYKDKYEVLAPEDGVVKTIFYSTGEQFSADSLLISLDETR